MSVPIVDLPGLHTIAMPAVRDDAHPDHVAPITGPLPSLADQAEDLLDVDPEPRPGSSWLPRPTVMESLEERLNVGRHLRTIVPRRSHAGFVAGPDRPDPVATLALDDIGRIPSLVPIRYGRMAVSPFTFLRGAAGVMAADLARWTPRTGEVVQACGDAHLLNFGFFNSPERTLLFDLNDFDETLPGPWEWDLKRLVASVHVAARDRGFSEDDAGVAVRGCVEAYAEAMQTYAQAGPFEIWTSRITAADILAEVSGRDSATVQKDVRKALQRNSMTAVPKLTAEVDGRRQIIDNPPLVRHVGDARVLDRVDALLGRYRLTLKDDRRRLLDHFTLSDFALKVVGVGSVGTACYIALLTSRQGRDPLFLQIKQARSSVLERHLGPSAYRTSGHRVVAGQRLLQSTSDVFLGWLVAPDGHFYVRQLRDGKGSIDLARMTPVAKLHYAQFCGRALARAHAKSGDAAVISGYVGGGGRLGESLASFARDYADRAEQDHALLLAAIRSGRVRAESGV